MAIQEECHALLGQSTPTANPVSSLASSAPEYDEPPPYTEEPAGPCECHCLYCKSISMLCTSLLDKRDKPTATFYTNMYPTIFLLFFLSCFLSNPSLFYCVDMSPSSLSGSDQAPPPYSASPGPTLYVHCSQEATVSFIITCTPSSHPYTCTFGRFYLETF